MKAAQYAGAIIHRVGPVCITVTSPAGPKAKLKFTVKALSNYLSKLWFGVLLAFPTVINTRKLRRLFIFNTSIQYQKIYSRSI